MSERSNSSVCPQSAAACASDTQLSAFLDGSLVDARRAELEAHLDQCAACRELVAHLGAVSQPARRNVGRYRLEAELGRGGMGVVWRAWDPALEREVAVKVLHPELDDEVFRKRALREARALARLQHPNVIAVHDVGQADGDVFIATELIDGEPLDRWQRGKSAKEILSAYAQAARGLAAAHALGLVHRDVKPANILMSRSGRVCVGDFGLAIWARQKHVGDTARPPNAPELPTLTFDGAVAGTPAYMAPEQRRGEPVGAAADQYALCLALAEALLGHCPSVGATVAELAGSGVVAPWPAIARGLDVDASRRFPDLSSLIASLEGSDVVLRAHRRRRLRRPAALFVTLAAAAGIVDLMSAQRPALARAPASAPATLPIQRGPIQADVSWLSPTDSRWRLPRVGSALALISPKLALVTLRAQAHQLVAVNLETGVTAAPEAIVDASAEIHRIVSVGGRWLASGVSDADEAVWELSFEPLRAQRVSWPSSDEAAVGGRAQSWVVSPSGALLVVCRPYGRTTVHDARSLRITRKLPAGACHSVHFADEHTLVTHDVQYDLRTGKSGPVQGDQATGPGGAVVRASDERAEYEVVRRGKVVQTGVPGLLSSVRWTPDGVAIGMGRGSINLRPSPDGSPRQVRLALESADDFAVDGTRAVILAGPVLEVIDLTTGKRSLPAGPLAPIYSIAPYGGAIAAASDRLLLQRRDEILAAEDATMTEIAAVSSRQPLIAVERYGGVWRWDPRTDQRAQLAAGASSAEGPLAGDDATTWFVTADTVTRWQRGQEHAPILRTFDRVEVAGLDARGQIWVGSGAALSLVDLRRRAAHTWTCEYTCFDFQVATAGRWAVAHRDEIVEAIDLRESKVVATLEPKDQVPTRASVLPTGQAVIAVGTELWLWEPGAAEVLAYDTGARAGSLPSALAVSRDGSEIAVGYDSGVIAYASSRAVLARATRKAAPLGSSSFVAPVAEARRLEDVAGDIGVEVLPAGAALATVK